MSVKSDFIYTIKGQKDPLNCTEKYKINKDSIIELKGEFRSAGKIKSKLHFGLRYFRENGSEIKREDINRIDESLIVTSINSDNKGLFVNRKPEKWNNKDDSHSQTYCKIVGIYLDGKIEHLPDYLIKYKNYENNLINLCDEIPKEILEKIIPYETKVMNHNSGNGNSWDYSAACGEVVPERWTEYKAVYEGFSLGYGDIKGKFRLGTREILPFTICNYTQNEDAILEIKNIEIIIKHKPKFSTN